MAKNKNITEQMIQEWIGLYNEGYSMNAIAKKYGTLSGSVRLRITDKVEIREKDQWKKYADEWKDMLESGYLRKEIAEKYGTTINIVTRVLKRYAGVDSKYSRRQFEHLLPTFIRLYEEGLSMESIGIKYGVSTQTVCSYLRDAGVDIRTYEEACRTYEMNDSFFDDIDTEYKAYILGVVYAIGFLPANQLSPSVRMCIAKNKAKAMEVVIDALHPTNNRPEIITRDDGCCVFQFNSKKIFHSLVLVGMNVFGENNYPDLDEELELPFMTGYFQTEVSYTSGRYIVISGKENILRIMRGKIILMTGIPSDKIKLNAYTNGTSYIGIFSKQYVADFIHFFSLTHLMTMR